MCQFPSTRPQPIQLVPTMQKTLYVIISEIPENYVALQKLLVQALKVMRQQIFLFSQCKVVLGACFGPQSPSLPYLEHPFLSLFRLKEPQRGWKSDMRTLSLQHWKRREFWHQQISKKKFVWKLWPFEVEIPVRAIFTIIITASDQLSRYTWSLTAVLYGVATAWGVS